MQDVNPLIILSMFFLRCVVPLIIMLGISYLLRRFGLIKDPPPAPDEPPSKPTKPNGDLMHGKV